MAPQRSVPSWLKQLGWAALVLAVGAGSAGADPTGGPHLTGDEYAALRGNAPGKILAFDLVLSTPQGNDSQHVTLGRDYVLVDLGQKATLYDFRFRRLLQIDRQDGSFTNRSLYAALTERMRYLTNNLGALAIAAKIKHEAAQPLGRFWMEQNNGVAHPAPRFADLLDKASFESVTEGSALIAKAEGSVVGTAQFGTQRFPTEDHRKSFAAWLQWSLPMHPDLAAALSAASTLPTEFTVNHKETGGLVVDNPVQTRKATLRNFSTASGLLYATRGLRSRPPAWPPEITESLAVLLVAAARGEAYNGPTSDEDYVAEIGRLSQAKEHLNAALLAVHSILPYDGCRDPAHSPSLCDSARSALQAAQGDEDTRRLFQALGVGQSGRHVESAEALIALRSDRLDRPHILEAMIANELVEAKRSNQLTEKLQAEYAAVTSVFTRSLTADPYNASRYFDFANHLRVSTASLEEHYDAQRTQALLDLARALPNRRIPAIIQQVPLREERIARDFPSLFPAF